MTAFSFSSNQLRHLLVLCVVPLPPPVSEGWVAQSRRLTSDDRDSKSRLAGGALFSNTVQLVSEATAEWEEKSNSSISQGISHQHTSSFAGRQDMQL